MVKGCVVFECNSSPTRGITLHKFPREVRRCKQWIQFVQKTKKWEYKPLTSRICSIHFSREAISNYYQVEMSLAKRFILTNDAVPTIYPSLELESATTSRLASYRATLGYAPIPIVSSRTAYRKREVARVS